MLYLNNELVNTRLNNDGKPVSEDFASVAKEYKKVLLHIKDYYGDTLVVETKNRPHPDPITNYPVFPGTRGILLQTALSTDNGMEEWVYSDTILKKEEGVIKLLKPNLLVQKGSFSVDVKRNPDLAFYLYKCNKVGKNMYEGKKFHFNDHEAVGKHNADKNRLIGKVMNMIYSSIPEDNLRTLAKSWGVAGVNIKDTDSVREDLFKMITDGQDAKEAQPGSTHKGYSEFIESSAVKLYDQIAALCSDAEEKGKLIFEEDGRRWSLEYGDGTSPQILKELSGDEFGRPLNALVDYLISEREELRKVENIMGAASMAPISSQETGPVEVSDNLSIQLIEETVKMAEVKKLVKEHCPEHKHSNTDKAEDLKAMLFRKLAELNAIQEPTG